MAYYANFGSSTAPAYIFNPLHNTSGIFMTTLRGVAFSSQGVHQATFGQATALNGSYRPCAVIGGGAQPTPYRSLTVMNDWGGNSSSYIVLGVRNANVSISEVRADGSWRCGNHSTYSSGSPAIVTTTNAANVFVSTDSGQFYRSTSSSLYKKDIEDLQDQYAEALLNARPVWYRSIAPGDSLHPNWGYWGFIAEEIAQIDPRLVFWKTHEQAYDENDQPLEPVELEEPEPQGVQYDRFIPHLLHLIKKQRSQIESLEARVAALESA